ncbi:MAG TPA: GDSL-type esterase/lipase family protein [Verrucomicrobiae bacterium]|jgi:lysophospholipase L1-like esterase
MRLVILLFLAALEVLMGAWVRLPAGVWAGAGLAGAALLFRRAFPGTALAALWIGSLLAWFEAARGGIGGDIYYSIMAGLMALAVWVSLARALDENQRSRWDAQVMAWLLCAALNWLAAGYLSNDSGDFHAGLLAALACLALCRWWFRWGSMGRQALNTLILLLAGLPIVDAVRTSQWRIVMGPATCSRYYSCNAARGDPAAFQRWEEYYGAQFHQLGLEIFKPDPTGQYPFVLRPGSRGTFIGCPISINSLGFRGTEFPVEKGDVYRIVVLGESTTFGMTAQPGDTPWPEMLEGLIRGRLKTRRPVQVINAGVPAYTILHNLHRLTHDVLRLQPDLIISYHGANGFSMLEESVLPPTGPIPPVYQARPIKLAADVEHRLRMLAYQRRARRRQASNRFVAARPLDTAYAAAYRQLIGIAAAHGIRLALANYSMAVNKNSDPRVIDFYQGYAEGGGDAAYGFIRANGIHSEIVTQLAREHPGICLIDTHPGLDGEHEKFIDIIHLTNEGRRQMAENMFQGIRGILERDLAPP